MQSMDTLTTLFHHNRWANLRLVETCKGLNDEQLDAAIVGGYGSIRDTLQHIARSEHSYCYRIRTGESSGQSSGKPPMSVQEIAESLAESGQGLIDLAGGVGADETVVVDWRGTPRAVPKTIFLTQAINHATEHRAQILTILTQLGVEPPSLDAWTFFDEMNR